MKLFIDPQDFTFYALLAITSFLLAAKWVKGSRKNGKKPPEAEGSWPIIGHLHLLGGTGRLLHRKLAAMADKYGPIFSICLGIHRVLVVSDWEVAKECFTTYDKVFPARPRSLAIKIMGYDHAMFGFAPYGQYWRDIRKIAMVELLSNHRLTLLKSVWDTEINLFVKELYLQSVNNGGNASVEIKEMFGNMAVNIIAQMVAGKRYFGSTAENNGESRRVQKALGDFFYLVGLFTVSDGVPFLGWLDWIKGYVREMKRTASELDSLLGSWLNEHREKRVGKSVTKEEKDFIHVMLSIMEDGNISTHDNIDTVIKATCLSIILGGNDTTAITLTWAISLLLNNRNVLKKAQEELDIQVGKDRRVNEADVKNLIYLQAIVKETLRLQPALPLSVPREALEDCTIAGFQVPAGTRLFVNLWKLHRDPNVWSNALEFQPERFLKEHAEMDVKGHDFKYMPFGSGRRMCPGVSFALRVVHLALAKLLHGFELETVSGMLIDMSETPGLTVPKATPLEVVIKPRLPPMIYEN